MDYFHHHLMRITVRMTHRKLENIQRVLGKVRCCESFNDSRAGENFFEKVTTLEVNWLVSQERSGELSNLLYLYPTKISNSGGYFLFKSS